jgi:predicted metal-dependent hydrolase
MSNKNIININGKEIEYLVERKKVKNLKLIIKADLSLRVVSPYNLTYKEINSFVNKKVNWISNKLEHFRTLNKLPGQEYKTGNVISFFDRKFTLEVIASPEQVIKISGDRMIIKVINTDEEIIEDIIDGWYRIHSKYYFNQIIENCLPKFEKYGIKKPLFSVRKMKRSWGSCSKSKNKIILNSKLAGKSMKYIEFIVMHELCHLIHPNHSKNFYGLLTLLFPEWKERKKEGI